MLFLVRQTVFEKDSAVLYQVRTAKKPQVLLFDVPASAHPVETLCSARLCGISTVGLMSTANQNPSEKEHQY